MKVIIQEEATKMNCEIMEMEVMPDHVHLLLEVDPQFGIHRAIRRIKGASSRLLRREFAQLRSQPQIQPLWGYVQHRAFYAESFTANQSEIT